MYSLQAEKGLCYLANRPKTEWVDSQLCWALDCLGRAGMTVQQPFVKASLEALIQRQGLNGAWASEDGEDYIVGATIEALKVLRFFGVI